jgi:oligopeptide transport system substrate-binding protein
LRASKAFGTAFLTLMCRDNLPPSILGGAKNPLADQRVREALAMAIDKKFIVEKITRMGEEVATTYFPPGTLPGFDVLPGLAADPGAARAKLAEAGYPGGKGFPSLPILYNSDNPIRANLAQALKEQWKRVLGIDVEIQSLEVKIYRNRVTEKEYAIALAAWYGDYPDVSTFTDKYHSTSLQNDSAWENKEFDSLLAQAAKESDVQKRMSILQRAEKFIDTEVPIIPLYHYVNCSMRREYVKGISENPRNLTVFKGLHLDKQVEKVN